MQNRDWWKKLCYTHKSEYWTIIDINVVEDNLKTCKDVHDIERMLLNEWDRLKYSFITIANI